VGRYDGKIAVVTGTAQGIGRATARRLSWQGRNRHVGGRAAAECIAVREEIAARGGHVSDTPPALPPIARGKIRALGVTTAKPFALAPEITPINDTVKGFDSESWQML